MSDREGSVTEAMAREDPTCHIDISIMTIRNSGMVAHRATLPLRHGRRPGGA
jgi:hypothetical protein